MRRKIIIPILIIVLIVFAIIVRMQEYNYPINSPPPQNFPLIEQPDQISCGPVSCAMLLNYYGKNVSFPTAKMATKTEWFKTSSGEPVGMTAPEFIQKALLQFGLPCRLRQGNIASLKYFVSQGRFPIALLRSQKTTWHYVVVVGYDEEKIYFADPGVGKIRPINVEAFDNSWKFSHDLDNQEIVGFDYLLIALKTADIYGQTIIVPKQPRGD